MADTAEIQNTAYGYAQTAFDNSVGFANNMLAVLNGATFDISTAINPPSQVYSPIGYAPPPGVPTLPTFAGVTAPVAPAAPTFTVPAISNIPDFTMAVPILNLPTAPSNALPGAPGNAPEFNAPALPDKPIVSLPAAPTFSPVAIPEPDAISIPVFDASTDFGDVTAPTERFAWSEQEYRSALLDATKAKLLDDILNGGYGIDLEDERRMWDRARERELVNASAKLAELTRMDAARGFSVPPGALQAQQEAAQQDLLEKNSSLSRDIAIKRADMFVENRRFAITSSIQMEDMLQRYFGGMAERALNAARSQVELGVAIFNAQVSQYNAKLEAFRAYASAYEARVRAALTGVEIYKARIEGARLSVETQKLYADVYATQVQGIQALIGVYRTEMEAAQIAATIENMKLQGFRTQVEVYAEQVRAKVSEFDMFEAQIKGELAKVQAYDANVRAYGARLSGIETQARVAQTVSQTEIARSTAQLEIYRTDMERYRAEIAVVTEKIRAALQSYDGELKQYSVATDALKAYGDESVRAQESNARNYLAYAQIQAANTLAGVDRVLKYMEVGASSNNTAAQTAANLGSAWASAVTGLTASIAST